MFKHLKHCPFTMCTHIIRKRTFDALSSFFFSLSSFLFKPSADFFKGKTVFNHWLPGICYSNITFQLVSEATFNKSTLVEYSGVQHEPKQHRTGEENPYTPFLPSLCCCFPCCSGEGIDPMERRVCVGTVLGAWEEDVVAIPWACVCKPCRGKLVWVFLS